MIVAKSQLEFWQNLMGYLPYLNYSYLLNLQIKYFNDSSEYKNPRQRSESVRENTESAASKTTKALTTYPVPNEYDDFHKYKKMEVLHTICFLYIFKLIIS